MIVWEHPTSLIALVLVAALALFLVWSARSRRRALAAFIAASLVPALTPDLDARRRTIRSCLLCVAVASIVVALGGPMWGFSWQEVRRQGIDLVVGLAGSISVSSLAGELRGAVERLHVIGDAQSPRTVEEATLEGARLGRVL